jgi:hypothetical protein
MRRASDSARRLLRVPRTMITLAAMESFTFLFGEPAWLVALVLFVACFLAAEGGYRLGRRSAIAGPRRPAVTKGGAGAENPDAAPASPKKKDHVGAAQTAVAALLGLLLAFSVSMAVDRYENRKAAVIDESNAIGTAYLRASFLPEPSRTEAVGVFKEYVEARLELARPDWFLSAESGLREHAASLQRRLWSFGVAATELDRRAVTYGLYAAAVNEMIDSAGRRDAGLRNHVPESVLYVLFGVSLATVGIMGYSSGLSGGRSLAAALIVSLIIAAVIFVILDFDRPYRGVIMIGQQSMTELRDSIELGLPLPPLR